jgi:hypothetical protein
LSANECPAGIYAEGNQVDFGSETHQNRHGLRVVSAQPTERILLGAIFYLLFIKGNEWVRQNKNKNIALCDVFVFTVGTTGMRTLVRHDS